MNSKIFIGNEDKYNNFMNRLLGSYTTITREEEYGIICEVKK